MLVRDLAPILRIRDACEIRGILEEVATDEVEEEETDTEKSERLERPLLCLENALDPKR